MIIFNRFLTNMPYNCIIFSKLALIASPSCGRFIQPNKPQPQPGDSHVYPTRNPAKLKNEFALSRKGPERGTWFIYTILAILVPFTSSKTSNILRCLNTLFGNADINKKRFYTFMASPKIPWQRLWQRLWLSPPVKNGPTHRRKTDPINRQF